MTLLEAQLWIGLRLEKNEFLCSKDIIYVKKVKKNVEVDFKLFATYEQVKQFKDSEK